MRKIFNSKVFWLIALGSVSSAIGVSALISKDRSLARASPKHLSGQKQLLSNRSTQALDSSTVNTRNSLLIATDLIDRQQGKAALAKLAGLEREYPLLAAHVLLAKGEAYQVEQNEQEAAATWEQVVREHPQSAAAAEALYLLGKTNPSYWEQAIVQFPAHPRTHEIIRARLQQNPNQPHLMAILVKYTPDDPGVDRMRDRLFQQYGNRLTPQEWQAIGDSYWLKWDYGRAGQAYAKATDTPQNLYRAGRGHHLVNSKVTAKQYYLKLVRQYPNDRYAGWAFRRLATLGSAREAITYLDLAIEQFPKHAPDALVEKAKYLRTLNSPKSATYALQTLITDYKDAEAAAQYRWDVAQKKARTGDFVSAWQWAQPITANNPDSELAPKAGFWIAKWAAQLNRPQDATKAYQFVLKKFPRSYYAWRSAVALGWDVGNFKTVRHKVPQVIKTDKIMPPGGSPTFQELYRLGLEREAWAQFQWEIGDRTEFDVADGFTLGLLKLYQGRNLRGINQIAYLSDTDSPEAEQQWQRLRQTPDYWQALYPFPYEDTILKWSKQRQLNPLLVTSLIRQESRFEPEIKSSAGAIGLMQVIPPTAKTSAKNIGLASYSMTDPEDNINIGTYYLDFTHNKYGNNSMLAVASYNAGPNAVAKWINRYGLKDADEFVAKIPYRETKGYVESVFENYWNYMLIYNPEVGKLFEQLES